MCGKTLSGVAYEELGKVADISPTPRPKGKLDPLGIAIMIGIFILAGIGSYELAVRNGAGFILILLGLVLFITLVGGWDAPPLRRR